MSNEQNDAVPPVKRGFSYHAWLKRILGKIAQLRKSRADSVEFKVRPEVYPTDGNSYEVYKEFDEAWRHEDNLINVRMTWLFAVQGGLIALLTFLLGSNGGGTFDFKPLQLICALLISGLAYSVTKDIQIGIQAAEQQIDYYKQQIQHSFQNHPPLPRTVFQDHDFKGFSAPRGIVQNFLLLWSFIFVTALFLLAKIAIPALVFFRLI